MSVPGERRAKPQGRYHSTQRNTIHGGSLSCNSYSSFKLFGMTKTTKPTTDGINFYGDGVKNQRLAQTVRKRQN